MYSEDFEEFSPKSYLDFSKKVYENIDSYKTSNALYSAAKRAIVSRIYYAAFLGLRECFKEKYAYMCSSNEHEYLSVFIISNRVFNGFNYKKLNSYLYILKKNRIQCDYKFNIPDKENSKENWASKSIEDLFDICDYIFYLIENFS